MLHQLVRDAALRTPESLAVVGPDGELSYTRLDRWADRIALVLAELGVREGDRVGIWLDKSAAAVATMQAVLRLGAAYVPLDPHAPPRRIASLVSDCAPAALVAAPERAKTLDEFGKQPPLLSAWPGGSPWRHVPQAEPEPLATPLPQPARGEDDLAYILYTSGSTGEPKGVCLSHRNALAFVDWAAVELRAGGADRFANHAPLHFDLSVLDLYVAFAVGASVHLVPQEAAYAPRELVRFLTEREITVWYSVPAALLLMMRHGELLETSVPTLRAVLFAGEAFPVDPLRRLRAHLPYARFLNLYGPTETNVCTYHEVDRIDPERTVPVPIGRMCSGDTVTAVRPDGRPAGPGEEGELIVSGPTVMLGYWGRPSLAGDSYPTGDIAQVLPDGGFQYVGRRDAMVKVRGHRIEFGEIEAALQSHDGVAEAAAVVVGHSIDATLVAFLVPAGDLAPSLLDLKRHSAARLPRHAIVDLVHVLPRLPRTGNGKVDRRALTELARAHEAETGSAHDAEDTGR
ncbi:amino acid adenylation domain-containing protein [Streptomyces niveus]|uniref:amino acid adenylation domain-containing protein n=1 Tax=Streptomyces niveus TaxID=193462 RepID=UPI00367F8336